MSVPPLSKSSPAVSALARTLALSESNSYGIYIGRGPQGAAFAAPQHGVLALGPPRSGKTTSIVVPNIVASCGPVLATSTKPDVLQVTSRGRALLGDCMLYDPSGTVSLPKNVRRIAWSPLHAASRWPGALSVAETMVLAARPGGQRGESAHWNERATALIAVAFHAGALGGTDFSRVLEAIDRRQSDDFNVPLARNGADLALNLLAGITGTDQREQSGIWSTAASVLAAYRTEAALASTRGLPLDVANFLAEPSTLYICAGSDSQRHAAPLVAGVIRDVRTAAYDRAAALSPGRPFEGPPLLLALDELANIAPLHDLPAIVSEGGSQGVVTLACLQDLTQAEDRWGRQAVGLLSLFQNKLVFANIADTHTLEMISKLGGEIDVVHTSETKGSRWANSLGQRASRTQTVSTRKERRFPVDVIAVGRPGSVLHAEGARLSWLGFQPWYADSDLRAVLAPGDSS